MVWLTDGAAVQDLPGQDKCPFGNRDVDLRLGGYILLL
jgi:hypothetical protein